MAQPRIVYALETASVALPTGEVKTIHQGNRYDADEAVVKQAPGFFTTDPTEAMVPDGVEQATAVPGERRNARRG